MVMVVMVVLMTLPLAAEGPSALSLLQLIFEALVLQLDVP